MSLISYYVYVYIVIILAFFLYPYKIRIDVFLTDNDLVYLSISYCYE